MTYKYIMPIYYDLENIFLELKDKKLESGLNHHDKSLPHELRWRSA